MEIDQNFSFKTVFAVSNDLVAREIEGELILVPLIAGVGDLDDELFTLNPTGRAVWDKLDGVASLEQIVDGLCHQYDAPRAVIEKDVVGLVQELLKRKIIVVVEGTSQ